LGVSLTGEFESWQDACARSSKSGGDYCEVEDAGRAAIAVLNGDLAFERDGVGFKEPSVNFPLIGSLALAAAKSGDGVRVLDFGGGFASAFLQHRALLEYINRVEWWVVERNEVCVYAKRNLGHAGLYFCDDLDVCIASCPFDYVLASGVLQYLEYPYRTLERLFSTNASVMLLDRIPVQSWDADDRIVLQEVFSAQGGLPLRYPSWIFARKELLSRLQSECFVAAEFPALDGEILYDGNNKIPYIGLMLIRKP